MKKSALLGLMFAGAAAAAAIAGPLDKSQVAKGAKWVVHVDVEAGLSSTVGQFFTQSKDKDLLEGLQKVRDETGMDPLSDVKGITVYGFGGDAEDGVAVLAVTPVIVDSVQRLQDKASNFKKMTEDGQTFYTWTEHGSTRFGQIRPGEGDRRIVVVASDKARLFSGIEVLEGKSASLAKDSEGMLARSPQAGSIIFAAANELGSAQAMPFDQAKGLVLDIGESGEQLFADLAVIPRNPDEAADLAQMMQGAVATARMIAKRDPAMADLVDLTQGITFGSSDKQITASIRISTDKLLECVKSLQKGHQKPAKDGGVNNEDDGGKRGR